MSKTGDDPIYLGDTPEDIQAKLKKAVTTESGARNLLDMFAYFGTKEQTARYESSYKTGDIKFSELKNELAETIAQHFSDFRKRKKELLSDKAELARILADGAQRARSIASQTLSEVKEKIGLL